MPRVSDAHTPTLGPARYRALLALPHARALLGWSLLGRLPLGMTPLALVLLVRGEGASYAAAGAVVAAYAVALGVGAPVAGRRVDRIGPHSVLRLRAVLYPSLLLLVVALALLDAGIPAIAAAAALSGLAMPPVSATVRAVWPYLATGDVRSTAFALEAALQELFFVAGPLLAAGLAAVSPALSVAGAAAASAIGASMTARLGPVRMLGAARGHGAGLLGALGAPGVRVIVVFAACLGAGFGAVEIAMPAFAEAAGSRELGGLGLAAFAGGSLIGGLVAGLRPSRSERRRLLLGGCAIGAGMLLFQIPGSIAGLCLAAVLAGLPIAPGVAAAYGLIDRLAPSGTVAEAFAWFGTAVTMGIACGSSLGGWIVDAHGVRWSFALGAVPPLIGVAVAWLARGALSEVEESRSQSPGARAESTR